MTDAPLATIVVPCKGQARQLTRCLQSLAKQSVGFPYETIVVDSASDSDVLSAARAVPGVRVVRSDGDLRAGSARNLGVRESRGDYLAFIDADCRAEEGWLATAVEGLRGGARMVGGPVLDALPWHPIAVTDNLMQFSDFGPRRKDGPSRYFPACNMAVCRETFLGAGGFPEVTVSAGEDTAFCDRVLHRWPHGLRFVREMRIRHDGRTGIVEFLRHQSAFGYARGVLGLHLTPIQRRWGARSAALPAVVVKRLSYLTARTVRWNPARSPRILVLLPLVVGGLCAWAGGFRRGCQHATDKQGPARDAIDAGGVKP